MFFQHGSIRTIICENIFESNIPLSQRENCSWNVLEMKLHHVEKKCEGCLEELDEEFYNCYGEFDATIKENPF